MYYSSNSCQRIHRQLLKKKKSQAWDGAAMNSDGCGSKQSIQGCSVNARRMSPYRTHPKETYRATIVWPAPLHAHSTTITVITCLHKEPEDTNSVISERSYRKMSRWKSDVQVFALPLGEGGKHSFYLKLRTSSISFFHLLS